MNILSHFFTIGLSSVINMLLSLFTTPIITRIVEPNEYGQFLVFNTYVGIIASFMYFGLNESLLRFFYEYDDEKGKRSLLKMCFSIPFFTSIIASLIAVLIYNLKIINIKFSFDIFVFLCINVVLAIWNCFSTEMLQNIQESRMYSIASIAQKAVYCFGSIALFFIFKKNYLLVLVLSTALSVLVSASIGTFVARKYWNFNGVVFPANKYEIAKYSFPSYIYFVVYSIYDTINNIIVERLCSDYEVGIYGSAFSLVGIFAIVQTAFTVIWRPIQTEHYTVNPDDTSFISKGNRYVTILMFFAGINIIFFKDILFLLLGKSYSSGAQVLPFLVFNPIMNTMLGTVTSGIEKSKNSKYKIYIIVISVAILFGLDALLIPKYGAIGAAISGSVSLIIQYYLTEFFSNKYYPIDYGTKNSIIMIISMIVYAYINSFYDFGILSIFSYLLIITIFILLYKKDFKEMYSFLVNSIKK